MSSVILLSSSPPRIFARSPTQAESPFHQQSPDGKRSSQICGRSSFKSTRTDRDRFTPTFTTTRCVLGTKPGAENSPLKTSGRSKFRLDERSRSRGSANAMGEEEDGIVLDSKSVEIFEPLPLPPERFETFHEELSRNMHIQILPNDVRKGRKNTESKRKPTAKQTTPRRTDWTPPKTFNRAENSGENSVTEFPAGLLQSFEFDRQDGSRSTPMPWNQPSKRRKLESKKLDAKIEKPRTAEDAMIRNDTVEKVTKKRSKSPVKKMLTITGLATSNYANDNGSETTPMMQYLVSTQAQALKHHSDNAVLETKVRKKRTVSSKAKPLSKSKLVSPTTAMKTLEDQDVIFASASQLVRNESPSLLRDVVDATKLSESQIMSDPVPSQYTAPISIESDTPRLGTSRFRGRRNLWGAADRDEDEALFHIDDSLDEPVLQSVFVGRDALVERGQSRSISPAKRTPNDSLHLLPKHDLTTLDIDDITTPHALHETTQFPSVQRRHIHTDVDKEKRGKTDLSPEKDGTFSMERGQAASIEHPVTVEAMPNYAGFTIEELKKQLRNFGFKNMRKRENMIAKLEQCWMDKDQSAPDEAASLRHGDFLSKIHDFSDRPKPKVTKARVRKRKTVEKSEKSQASGIGEIDSKIANAEPVTAARPRGRPPKTSTVRDAAVLDVDEILNVNYFDKVSAIPAMCESPDISDLSDASDSEAEVPSFTGVGRIVKVNTADNAKLPTPPSTVPVITISSSPPAFEDTNPLNELMPTPQSFESAPSQGVVSQDLPDIKCQVGNAIKHCSMNDAHKDKVRNHHKHPTFHEKILMYDPIILEDLTAWLNTEGLNAIGEDREVDIMDVRAWCEENGICCLWKGGWRGRGLKGRTDGGNGIEGD